MSSFPSLFFLYMITSLAFSRLHSLPWEGVQGGSLFLEHLSYRSVLLADDVQAFLHFVLHASLCIVDGHGLVGFATDVGGLSGLRR